ncbi:Coiled-coil and C2 domain-containing protein 2A, partial [Desmophyllum pertusum]
MSSIRERLRSKVRGRQGQDISNCAKTGWRRKDWLQCLQLTKQRDWPEGIPTEEEAYHFFVGKETKDKDKKEAEDTEQEPEEPTEEPRRENELLTFWGKPPYKLLAKQLQDESNLYKIPSLRPVPLDDKVPDGVEPRFWEEEGFYIGKPPQVSSANLNIMENRIKDGNQGTQWFGEDGQLKRLSSPLKEKPTRPPVVNLEELDPLLQTEWVKAHMEPFDGRFISAADEEAAQYQLDVDLSTLTFTHHPLFSKEHVLASRLQQFYKQYTEKRRKALSSHYSDKLAALKIALQQLQENAEKVGKGKTRAISVADTNKRIKEYKGQIRQTRKLRDSEDYSDRVLLKNMLKCWREIKALRESQGYVNTQFKLAVRREETNKEEDEALFEEEMAEELQERREEFDEQYQDKQAEYEEELKEWKIEAKRRKRARQEGQESSLIDEEADGAEGLPPRPTRPPQFDEVAEYEKLKENAQLKRRAPGEPILIPELLMTANVTPIDQVTRPEKQRRTEMQNWSAFIKVLFNGKEVSRTIVKRLSADFTVHFGEIHNIQIVQWPENIRLQLMESGIQNKLVAELYVPIPEPSHMSGRVELESFEFSSDHQVFYKHEGVGSGQPLDFASNNAAEPQPPIYLLTSGTILASVSWAVGNDGKAMAPPLLTGNTASNMSAVKRYDALAALGAAGMVDIQNLIKWIEQSHLDPNDPANADIMNIIKLSHSLQDGPNAPQYFRLNQLEEECEFVSQKEFAKSKRFKLIQLRDKGVTEFKNFKMIPSRDREVPDNVFDAYEKRQRGEQEEEEAEDEIFSHKTVVTKFLNKIRDDVTQRSLIAKRQMELKDMIIEDEVPDIGDIGVQLGKLFAPRRPLRPVRKERKVVGAQNLTVSDVKVFINVVRALDIPVRDDVQPAGGTQGAGARFGAGGSLRAGATSTFTGSGPGYGGAPSGPQGTSRIPQVRPFVEAVFQGQFSSTTVADGPNPSWNEELIIPFRAPNNDYSPETLQTVNDVVYLNLFDEVVFNILQDDRQQSTNIHQRLERHWLGSIEIPFSTIYFNNKVEGTFRVNTPPVLLGYHKRGRHSGAPGDLGIISRNDTLLTLFVTIEPPLQPSQPMAERFESNEDDKLLHNAQLWLGALRKKYPKREYKALATNLSGKKVFLTRYIRSQNPPAELLEETQYKMERIARYVAMVPFISDSAAFPDLCDIWATSEEFLRMLAGDEEEHAVLLCNYFLHIGKRAFVVLGRGIPEGSTAYVLTLEGSPQLWNAHSGQKYDVQDANCPLKSIGCVFNHENIWGNVQVSEEPYRLLFDFTKTNSWQPFFTKSYPRPALLSNQREILEYKRVDQEYVTGLQDKIEKMLRDKIMSWRPRFVTRWNRYCTQAFRSLLANMEQSVGQTASVNHAAELDQILASYKLSGFPINMSFTEMPPVSEAVFSTGVHTIEDPDVEFALAVHIHPYPQGCFLFGFMWVRCGEKLAIERDYRQLTRSLGTPWKLATSRA